MPQAYLRHFCDENGEVLRTFLAPTGQLFEKRFSPKAAGYEEHLYSFQADLKNEIAHHSDQIEREVFGPLDNDGINAVRKIIDLDPSHLSPEETEHLALFLNSFLERHPQRLRERDDKASRTGEDLVQSLKREWRPPPDGRPDVLDMVNAQAMARNALRRCMVEQILDPKSVDYLKGFTFMKLNIQRNPVLRFVTGDNPVLVNLGQPWPVHWLTFSLNPETLLIAHGFAEPMEDVELLFDLALIHNIQLLKQCEYVFSRDSLSNSGVVNTRTAGEKFLRSIAWARTKRRRSDRRS